GVLEHERGRERAAEARGEIGQELRLARSQVVLGLFARDFALAHRAREDEAAALRRAVFLALLALFLGKLGFLEIALAHEQRGRLDDRAVLFERAAAERLGIHLVLGRVGRRLVVPARRLHFDLPRLGVDRERAAVGAPAARGEAVDLPGRAVRNQGAHRALVEVAPGDVLPEAHRTVGVARGLLAAAVEPRHLDHGPPAGRAVAERLVRIVELVVAEALRAIDDLDRVVGDLAHEVAPGAPAALDLEQVEFDLAGQL